MILLLELRVCKDSAFDEFPGRLRQDLAPLKQLDNDHNGGDHQQKVNEISSDAEHEAEQPKKHQNDRECPQHGKMPFLIPSRSADGRNCHLASGNAFESLARTKKADASVPLGDRIRRHILC
jgi:hypothetical protein